MSKHQEKIKARKMRREGISIIAIAKNLGVTKGSVSVWCQDIVLTDAQNTLLTKNKGLSVTTGQRMGAEANKKKRIDAIFNAEQYGQRIIKKISKQELLLIATALYWCEGSKSRHTSGFIFVNSDPQMILVMKLFLINVMSIPTDDIVYSIQINRIHEARIDTVLSFWQKLLHLPKNQFRKPYYINTNVSKVYENYEQYYGICRLIVRRSMNLKYKMLGLIKAIKDNVLSA